MDKNELIEFLKDNLSISTREYNGWYGDTTVYVDLKVGDVVVSSDSINMPKECRCSCGSRY